MFTSAAEVFRARQVMGDLRAYVFSAGHNALGRIASDHRSLTRLLRVIEHQGGKFRMPADKQVYGQVLLAAALPDDDFPAFTVATALLLVDRIAEGHGEDNLYWNWDAFAEHYRMADPNIRAPLMNGFRLGATLGRVSMASPPDAADCLTRGVDDILPHLRRRGHDQLVELIQRDANRDEAGAFWSDWCDRNPPDEVIWGARYLYERPVSLVPREPDKTPLIPWTV